MATPSAAVSSETDVTLKEIQSWIKADGRKPLPDLSGAERIGDGRYGTIYRDPRNPRRCVKVLVDPLWGPETAHLTRLVEIVRWARPSDLYLLLTRFAWPVELFGTERAIYGFAMPMAPPSCTFTLTAAGRTQMKQAELTFLMNRDYWSSPVVSSDNPADTADLLAIAIDCFDSLSVLHSHGLCYGDISYRNLLARLETSPGIFFLDADSISTPETRATSALESPGWEVPQGLSPLEVDRSRFSLLVTRFLAGHMDARPSESASELVGSAAADGHLIDQLIETYAHGSEAAFNSLGDSLRSRRTRGQRQDALQVAQRLGFARWVVREAGARGVADRHLLAQARAQLEFEASVDASSGLEYRTLLRRSSLTSSPFQLDVRPRLVLEEPPTSAQELHQVIYDARFGELASHLSVAGLGPLESDAWLERAVQIAHAELPDLPLEVRTRRGEATVQFSWPGTAFVNRALLVVETQHGPKQTSLVRSEGEPTPVNTIDAPDGLDGMVRLAPGTATPSGTVYFGGRFAQQRVQIEPLPTPVPRPPAPRRSRGVGSPPETRPHFELLSPAELESRRLAYQRMRRRRAIRRSAWIVIGLATLGGVGLAARSLLSNPLRSEASASLFLTVRGTPGDYWVTWTGAPVAQGEMWIQVTYDGEIWNTVVRTPASVSPINERLGGATIQPIRGVRVGYSSDSAEPGFFYYWPDPVTSGLDGVPQVALIDGRVEASWQPNTTAQGGLQGYEYRYSQPGSSVWYRDATSETSVVLDLPEPFQQLYFSVRVVTSSGEVGPWLDVLVTDAKDSAT